MKLHIGNNSLLPFKRISVMSKNSKIFLGILTFSPLLYIVFFVFFMFISMFFSMSGNHDHGPGPFMFFPFIFLLHMLAMLLILALWIYYLIHVTRNQALDSNNKTMWILIIVLGSFIGSIAYFYVNIWKDPKPKPGI